MVRKKFVQTKNNRQGMEGKGKEREKINYVTFLENPIKKAFKKGTPAQKKWRDPRRAKYQTRVNTRFNQHALGLTVLKGIGDILFPFKMQRCTTSYLLKLLLATEVLKLPQSRS